MTELEKRERNEPRKPGLPTRDEIEKVIAKATGVLELPPSLTKIKEDMDKKAKREFMVEAFHSALSDILRECSRAPHLEEIRRIEHIVQQALALYRCISGKTKYRNFKDMYFHEKEAGK